MGLAVHGLIACQLLLAHHRLLPHHFQQIHHSLLLARRHYHHWHHSLLCFLLFQFKGYHRNYHQSNVSHLLLDMPYK